MNKDVELSMQSAILLRKLGRKLQASDKPTSTIISFHQTIRRSILLPQNTHQPPPFRCQNQKQGSNVPFMNNGRFQCNCKTLRLAVGFSTSTASYRSRLARSKRGICTMRGTSPIDYRHINHLLRYKQRQHYPNAAFTTTALEIPGAIQSIDAQCTLEPQKCEYQTRRALRRRHATLCRIGSAKISQFCLGCLPPPHLPARPPYTMRTLYAPHMPGKFHQRNNPAAPD